MGKSNNKQVKKTERKFVRHQHSSPHSHSFPMSGGPGSIPVPPTVIPTHTHHKHGS